MDLDFGFDFKSGSDLLATHVLIRNNIQFPEGMSEGKIGFNIVLLMSTVSRFKLFDILPIEI